MEKFNLQLPVRYGLIAFAMALTIGLLTYFFLEALMLIGVMRFISFGLVLFLAIWCGISYRRENGGAVSFGHAFLAVFAVFIFYISGAIITQLLVNKVIDTHYAEKASSFMRRKMSESYEKMNKTDDQIKEATKGMTAEQFDPPFDQLILPLLTAFAFMALVSAIIAAFIKRGSSDLIDSGAPPNPISTI